MITIIVARNLINTIGNDGKIPWYIPEDLRMFENLTRGTDLVMGRKTWNSLPNKPLKGRRNYVLSKEHANDDRYVSYQSITDIPKHNLSVIGGESIYNLFIDLAHEIYLTTVFDYTIGDTFFEFDEEKWGTSYKTKWFKSVTGTKYQYSKLVRK